MTTPSKTDLSALGNAIPPRSAKAQGKGVEVVVMIVWSPDHTAHITKLRAEGADLTQHPMHGDSSNSPYQRSAGWRERGKSVEVDWTVGIFVDAWAEVFAWSEHEAGWKSLGSKYVDGGDAWSDSYSYFVP